MTPATSALPGWSAAYRFLLEMAALIAWGVVGWRAIGGPARYVLAALLPIGAAILWGTFRVPDDESASGDAPIPVTGRARLVLELALLLGAGLAAAAVWRPVVGAVLAALVVVHYATTPRRVRWLLARRSAG